MNYPITYRFTDFELRWAHGGGHVHGVAYWRWRGWLVAVVRAGQA